MAQQPRRVHYDMHTGAGAPRAASPQQDGSPARARPGSATGARHAAGRAPAPAGGRSSPTPAGGRTSPTPVAVQGLQGSPQQQPGSPGYTPGGVPDIHSPGSGTPSGSPQSSGSPGSGRRGSPKFRGPSLDTSTAGLAPAEPQKTERLLGANVVKPGDPEAAQGRFAITVEDPDDPSKPLSPLPTSVSPSRRVRHFKTEEEQDGYVLGQLKHQGMAPGSPSHKVQQVLGLATPHVSRRRMSKFHPPTQEECPLFPGRAAKLGTEEWVPRLNRLLKGEPANEVLPFAEYHDVMIACSSAAQKDPGCPIVEVGEKYPPLSIVGDLHGQLANLLRNVLGPVLRGEMSVCRWLFLGDLVDRGPEGCEVLAIVALMKLCWPDQVYILRGNHEDAPISYVYGFFQECENKYGTTADGSVWQSANYLFMELPIAAVVKDVETGKKFFCCHGGLTHRMLQTGDVVSMINGASRLKYGQMRMGEVMPGEGPSSPMADQTLELLEGLMWSDPVDDADCTFRPSARGAGDNWGKDASKRFCEQNRFEFVCRAHQMVQPGYHRQHKGLVLTVFSAADYCNMGNKGAVLRVEKDKVKGWKHRIAQYDAPPPDTTPQQAAMPLLPYFRSNSGGLS